MKKLKHWIVDYVHMLHGHSQAFYAREPGHFLGYTKEGKVPIILIPGVFSKWHFLKFFADPLSQKGHPIYIVRSLGYNTRAISHSAKLVHELINEKNLRNVVIIAHSKGGLIGKYVIAFLNKDKRVRKVIAVATPFGGSYMAKYFSHEAFIEIHPHSTVIQELQAQKEVNKHIVSIFGVFDSERNCNDGS